VSTKIVLTGDGAKVFGNARTPLAAAVVRPNCSRKLSRVQCGFGLGIGTAA